MATERRLCATGTTKTTKTRGIGTTLTTGIARATIIQTMVAVAAEKLTDLVVCCRSFLFHLLAHFHTEVPETLA
jgi:hypothetical protein